MQIRTTKNHPEGYKTFVHRVNYCLRCRIDSQKGVGVRINEEREPLTMTICNAVEAFGLVRHVRVK